MAGLDAPMVDDTLDADRPQYVSMMRDALGPLGGPQRYELPGGWG